MQSIKLILNTCVWQHSLYITSNSTKTALPAAGSSLLRTNGSAAGSSPLLLAAATLRPRKRSCHLVSRVIVSWWQATACLVFERSTFYTWPTVKKQGIVRLRPSDFSEPYNYLAKRLGPLYKCTRDGGVLCEGCSDVRRCVFRVTAPSDGITPHRRALRKIRWRCK
jgi:hypothetical protein